MTLPIGSKARYQGKIYLVWGIYELECPIPTPVYLGYALVLVPETGAIWNCTDDYDADPCPQRGKDQIILPDAPVINDHGFLICPECHNACVLKNGIWAKESECENVV